MKRANDIVDCVLSLTEAITDAGGSVSAERLKTMTLMEFITDIAAPNYIRFVYVPLGRDERSRVRDNNDKAKTTVPTKEPLPINKPGPVVICRYSKSDGSKIYLRVTNGDSMGWVEEQHKHLATSFMSSLDASSIYMELRRLAGMDAVAMDAIYGVANIERMTVSSSADKGE